MNRLNCFVAAMAIGLMPTGTVAQNASEPAGARAIAAAYNATGQVVMRTLAARPGNIVFSPLSIGVAMTLATHGARGPTRDQMEQVLSTKGIPGSRARDLVHILTGYDTSARPATCPRNAKVAGDECGARGPSAQIAIANGLMVLQQDVIADAYVNDLKRDYDAEVFRNVGLDFINDWVRKKTGGRIDKILKQFDPSSVAVILNAAYFKATWASVFSKRQTDDAPFWIARDRSIPVKTMHQVGQFQTVRADGLRAIHLPYTVPQLGMVVVVPDAKDGVDAISARLDAAGFATLSDSLKAAPATRVNLALPKFKINYEASVIPALAAAGLKLPFGRDADFSGMTTQPAREPGLYIRWDPLESTCRHASLSIL